MKLDQLYQTVINMTASQRIVMAKQAASAITEYGVKNGLKKDDAKNFAIYYFKLFVSADADCDFRERDIFNSTFGMDLSSRQFTKLISDGNDPVFVEKMTRATHKMPEAVQVQVARLGLSIMCSDGVMTASEQALLSKVTDKDDSLVARLNEGKK